MAVERNGRMNTSTAPSHAGYRFPAEIISRCGDTWHLDEVFLKINGHQVYLWHAVDQEGEVLDILVQKRRNAKAAKRFFRKLLKGLKYVPRSIVTAKGTSPEPASSLPLSDACLEALIPIAFQANRALIAITSRLSGIAVPKQP
jgi:transposase-like protein